VRQTRDILPNGKSLIGFVGGPWTLFAYAVEGRHKGELQQTKRELSLFPRFCELLVPFLINNIELQLAGGAEVVMIFDTAAGELSPTVYQGAVIPKLAQLAQTFPGKLGYYAKGITHSHVSRELSHLPWAGMGFDHR